MKKIIFRNILHALAVGGAAAAISAIAIGLASMAVWVYCTIPATCGYVAVALFGLATLALAAALAIVYMCGCWITYKGKFSK